MKILLVTASFEVPHRGEGLNMDSHYPLGIASIHAYLKQRHDVAVLFLNDYPENYCTFIFANYLAVYKPDVIGFNILSMNRVQTYMLIDFVKITYPYIKVILGGIHATCMAEQLFKKFPFVTIVKGEGELIFEEAINSPPGIMQGRQVQNLDDLPFVEHAPYWNEYRVTASILTSRGCPFSCSFCVLKNISEKKIRYRSVNNVLSEIDYLVKTFPNLRRIWWEDDAATMDNERMIKICKGLISRGYDKIIHICSARVKPVSLEMLKIMERAGFRHILFGLESGSPEILKKCHKGITQEDVIHCHELMAKTNMISTYFLMVGLPGETEKTILETADFINKLQKIKPIKYEDIGITMIYPGCEVYDIAKAHGIIDDNFWLSETPVPYYTAENSLEELSRLKEILLKRIR